MIKSMGNRLKRYRLWAAALLVSAALFAGYTPAVSSVTELTAREAHDWIERHRGDPESAIVDMRTPGEYRQGHIAGAVMVDYYHPQFKAMLDRLDRHRTYLVYCRSGNRSGKALNLMQEMGFDSVYHLKGGVLDWRAKGFELVKPE